MVLIGLTLGLFFGGMGLTLLGFENEGAWLMLIGFGAGVLELVLGYESEKQ